MPKHLTLLIRAAFTSLCAALALSAHAASLIKETPARLAPSDTAAVLRILPSGSQLRPADATSELPPNWQAIILEGPFTFYVRNGDIDKGLAIKPASPLYLEPDNAAVVVAYAEEGDAIIITGLHGRWTQIELQKPLTAYVLVSGSNAPATTENTANNEDAEARSATTMTPVVTSSTENATVALPDPEKLASEAEPESESAVETVALVKGADSESAVTTTAAQSAVATPLSQISQSVTAPLNRSQIQGKLVSTRKRFAPRRPYDWQINAKFSFRIAYLDFSRMQGTDQLARYEGQQVVVYGLVSPLGDGQYVMQVESIRLQ